MKSQGQLKHPITEEEKRLFKVVKKAVSEEGAEDWLSQYRYARRKAIIFREHSVQLNMGTKFDAFKKEAATRHFEQLATENESLSSEEQEILLNRRFMYKVMKDDAFSNYEEEWWHWSSGDNMDAVASKKGTAIYGGVELSSENITFDKSRKSRYRRAIRRVGTQALFDDSLEEDPRKIHD